MLNKKKNSATECKRPKEQKKRSSAFQKGKKWLGLGNSVKKGQMRKKGHQHFRKEKVDKSKIQNARQVQLFKLCPPAKKVENH
jgi:hypothetical protein